MDNARLFQTGRSQAVRLPKAYRFSGTELIVKHVGNGVLLLPIEDPWRPWRPGSRAVWLCTSAVCMPEGTNRSKSH
jgi:antitoxin VapB